MRLATEQEQNVCDSASILLDRLRVKQVDPLTPSDVATALCRAAEYVDVRLDPEQELRSRRYLEERYVVAQGPGIRGGELKSTPIPDWVPRSKPAAEWPFWYRYQRWLKNRVAPGTLQNLDEYTDRILTKLGNPKLQPANHPDLWDIRGMVAGHVQSGKTSNYIGVICKAADAGYKLIVVLTGIHENLRVQTQRRIDDGFIGKRAAGNPKDPHRPTGVGDILVPGVENQPLAFWGTTQNAGGDFRAANLNGFGVDIRADLPPVVLVVKKNASVLRRLLKWVVGELQDHLPGDGVQYEDKLHPVPHYYRTHCPLLVVDDEADQASVDTAAGGINDEGDPDPDHDPTTINRLIRSLIRSFDRSAYVGYTATPFANILIHDGGRTSVHGDDLFPRDFIVNLPISPAYVGPSTIFGQRINTDVDDNEQDGLPVLLETVRDHVDHRPPDAEEGDTWMAFAREGWMPPVHSRDHQVGDLPESLRNAIADWTLAGAGLICRGRGHEHHSMLIHVSRFQNVMNNLHEQVGKYWDDWSLRVANGDDGTMAFLRRRWDASFPLAFAAVRTARPHEDVLLSPIDWRDLTLPSAATGKTPLQQSVDAVQVLQIHGGESGQPLDYDRGQLKVIAIGGNKLSRGLTLENLTVSYFLRTTLMYDTLMQMGRWFGYRPGFLDLCRLYLPSELRFWFESLADAIEELRNEFERMAAQGSNPSQYGLRVRSHPLMTVTSAVKMRSGRRIMVSFADTLTQSIVFDVSRSAVEDNWRELNNLVSRLGPHFDEDPEIERPGKTTVYRGYRWKKVPAANVIHFLEHVRTPWAATEANGKRIADFIQRLNEQGELVNWTVFLRNNPQDLQPVDLPHSVRVGRSYRRRHPQIVDESRRGEANGTSLSTKVLIDSEYESVDLNVDAYQEALTLRRAAQQEDSDAPGGYVRLVRPRTNGLLLLYAVQPYDPAVKKDGVEVSARKDIRLTPDLPIVGFAVSLPSSESTERVEYIVGNVYLRNEDSDSGRGQEELGD